MSDPAPELRVTELAAADRHRLLDQVYDELRILARKILSADRARAHLAPNELVNGAAIKIIGQRRISARERTHFFAFSAHIMRQVLIDAVRRKRADKRGGPTVTLITKIAESAAPDADPVLRCQAEFHVKRIPSCPRLRTGRTTGNLALGLQNHFGPTAQRHGNLPQRRRIFWGRVGCAAVAHQSTQPPDQPAPWPAASAPSADSHKLGTAGIRRVHQRRIRTCFLACLAQSQVIKRHRQHRCGHRARKVVALKQHTAPPRQIGHFFGLFSARRDDPQVQSGTQNQQSIADCLRPTILMHVRDKSTIDLDRGNRQTAQGAHIGVAIAEIVNRDPHPQVPQGPKSGPGVGMVDHRDGFGQLDFQLVGPDPRRFYRV